MKDDLISRQAAIAHAVPLNLFGREVMMVSVSELENLPSAQFEERTEERTETHACDLISRQAALEKVRAMQTYKLFVGDDMILVDKAEVQTELMMLPTAQTEPQEGHWIKHETPDGSEQYECSECGVLWEFNDGTPEDNEAYFCPNCGAKMTISK